MAFTFEKTWVGTAPVNQRCGTYSTTLADNQALMYALASSLLTANGANSWTCWGSCDGAGNKGNGDAVFRWSSGANCIWAAAGSNHSWAVFTQANINTKAAVCIDLNNANSYWASVVMSPAAGFGAANGGADGTATARPTATDEIVIVSANSWGGVNAASSARLHVFGSSDGQCTRIAICRAGVVCGFWLLDKPKNPHPAWSNPAVGMVLGTSDGSAALTIANVVRAANVKGRGAATFSMYCGTDFVYGYSGVVTNVPEFRYCGETFALDDWECSPITGLHSTTAGYKGKCGELFDLYLGSATNKIGTSFPSDRSYDAVQLGALVFPANGIVLEHTS